MVEASRTMRKNKIAVGSMDIHDSGWSWLIKYLSILARNPCYLEGMLTATTELEGMLQEATELESEVGMPVE